MDPEARFPNMPILDALAKLECTLLTDGHGAPSVVTLGSTVGGREFVKRETR